MSIYLGSTKFGSLYLGSTKIGEAYLGSVKVYGQSQPDPYNPLNLPQYTLRLLFRDGVTPSFSKGTGVQVSSSPNVWDLTYENTVWSQLLYSNNNLIEVLGANSSGVTSMSNMLGSCYNLQRVAVFDTSSVTNFYYFCNGCQNLKQVPLLNTSSATEVSFMFTVCHYVESGALALYQQMTSQQNPPTTHYGCFANCGDYTVSGQAELAQIPSDWK